MRFLLVFLLYIASASADAPVANLSGTQWLAKVSEAMKNLSYHGTVVFMKNGQLDTMKYQHVMDNGIEIERLTSLNSPLREVTRKSNEISCLYKETSQKTETQNPIDRSFIVNLPAAPEKLDQHYLFALASQEMVAMRPAQIVAVLPKDGLRYARKIWVDKATWLPLKVEVYGQGGNTLEQVLFTELEIGASQPVPATEAASAQTEAQTHARVAQAESLETAAFQLKNWPAGFEKVFFIRNIMQQSQKTVEHLLLSDGFSNVSVYFEAKGDKTIEGLRSLGPVNSYSRAIGKLQVTVLGEVPAETVEFVARGVALRGD